MISPEVLKRAFVSVSNDSRFLDSLLKIVNEASIQKEADKRLNNFLQESFTAAIISEIEHEQKKVNEKHAMSEWHELNLHLNMLSLRVERLKTNFTKDLREIFKKS